MAVTMNKVANVGRKERSPEHTFQLRHRPWQIQPFFIAPVLPGETFKNYLLQSRVVTDPIKNPLIGWWQEYYVFYVKLRDIDQELFENLMLDAEAVIPPDNGDFIPGYHKAGAVNYTGMLTPLIAKKFFKVEGEEWDAGGHFGDYLPVASINRTDWLDSATNDADFVGAVDLDVDANADGDITASEVDKALRTWQILRAQNLTEMDFDDYLATFGVRTARENAPGEPELIRYHKVWSYPVNTVDPATGSPSSAVSWAIQERADKDRFCREPGFLFGVTISRPKVYLSGMNSQAVGMMNDALSWLPAIMRDDPYTSMKRMAAGSPPLDFNTDAYWVDLKDLFLYGDQFVNFALTATDAGMVALPTAGLQKRYPTSDMANALFVASEKNKIKQDGIIKLSILGSLTDTTPPVTRMV